MRTVKQAIQDVLAPELQELKEEIAGLRGDCPGEFGALRAEVAGVHGEIRQIEKPMENGLTSIRTEMNVRCAALGEKFTPRLDYTNKRLEDAPEIRERLAVLEARVASHS
jgi:phage host-nuclease inhibitor protein Gam